MVKRIEREKELAILKYMTMKKTCSAILLALMSFGFVNTYADNDNKEKKLMLNRHLTRLRKKPKRIIKRLRTELSRSMKMPRMARLRYLIRLKTVL